MLIEMKRKEFIASYNGIEIVIPFTSEIDNVDNLYEVMVNISVQMLRQKSRIVGFCDNDFNELDINEKTIEVDIAYICDEPKPFYTPSGKLFYVEVEDN